MPTLHPCNMTDIMDICETSDYGDFNPITCAIDEVPPSTRCISIESGDSLDNQRTCFVTDGAGDFFDDYDIYPTVLGTGTYGCVRECLHRSSGEKYAVKTIEKSKVDRLDHIQQEIQLLRSINHPGIMKMVDCYEDEHFVHIVTEKYTGGELFDRIIDNTTENGCFREDEAIRIIRSLLEAVQYLHRNDIVHRDIKPENILFETAEEGSTIKLIDFGLSQAHRLTDPKITGTVGTLYYMSPEVLQGGYDRACDLWSVGVVTYVLLCGYAPFNGSTDNEIQDSICSGDLMFEEKIWGHLSSSSRDFVCKLLSMECLSKINTVEEALQHPWVSSA